MTLQNKWNFYHMQEVDHIKKAIYFGQNVLLLTPVLTVPTMLQGLK